jgi:uncharacterized protein (TIGR03435 family)
MNTPRQVPSYTEFMRKLLLAALAITALAGSIPAQPGPAAALEFEVASVKPVLGEVPNHPVGLRIHHGTLNVDDARLRQIIGLAYGIQRVNVQGGPDWLDTDKYNIIAKAGSADASPDQIKAMLQTLLADRFKLALHRETKELPVYTLVVGKNGSKLQEAKEEERTTVTNGAAAGRIQMTFQKHTLATLVNTLANMLGSPVLDKTGLTGRYDFKLEWAPDLPRRVNGDPPLINGVPVESGPDIFLALQEQLGLKLEKKKGPAEVLVVDHAEKASEN